jgi:hypothetical protein
MAAAQTPAASPELWLLRDGRRDAARRPGLGFLESQLFRGEIPDSEGWKSLDFLGFSRQNLDLSMNYTRFSVDVFFGALFLRDRLREALDEEPAVEAMRKRRIVHGAS